MEVIEDEIPQLENHTEHLNNNVGEVVTNTSTDYKKNLEKFLTVSEELSGAALRWRRTRDAAMRSGPALTASCSITSSCCRMSRSSLCFCFISSSTSEVT